AVVLRVLPLEGPEICTLGVRVLTLVVVPDTGCPAAPPEPRGLLRPAAGNTTADEPRLDEDCAKALPAPARTVKSTMLPNGFMASPVISKSLPICAWRPPTGAVGPRKAPPTAEPRRVGRVAAPG